MKLFQSPGLRSNHGINNIIYNAYYDFDVCVREVCLHDWRVIRRVIYRNQIDNVLSAFNVLNAYQLIRAQVPIPIKTMLTIRK